MKYIKSAGSFLFLFIVVFISACHFNSTYLNRGSDIADGKNFINNFYANVVNMRLDSLNAMEGDSLKILAGKDALTKLITSAHNKFGAYKDYTVAESFTQRTEGTDPGTVYKFQLNVIYANGKAEEQFFMVKKGKDPIKLYGYHINSDLLLK